MSWEIYFADKNISGAAFWKKRLSSIVFQILLFRKQNKKQIEHHIETLGKNAQRITDKSSDAYKDTVSEISRLKTMLQDYN